MTSSFKDLGLSSQLLQSLTEEGYIAPTAIQQSSIPFLLQGHDLLGCAQTGTGKTASFLLPLIDQLAKGRQRARMPRAIILEPTRELAIQIMDAFNRLSKKSSLSAALIIGGESMASQEKLLNRGVDILVSTPGRFLDLQQKGLLLLTAVHVFILDEADRMLDMGFLPDIERIFSMLPAKKQAVLFSATISPEIQKLSQRFLKDPKIVTISPPSSVASTINQNILNFSFKKNTPLSRQFEGKITALIALMHKENMARGIVFCNRKKDVEALAKKLTAAGHQTLALHGDLPQSKRSKALADFKEQKISWLVASDVAARGLDIEDMPHVISFDVPSQAEDYVHRIGRTGRAGRQGHSFLFASPQDSKAVQAIETLIRTPIPVLALETEVSSTKAPDSQSPSKSHRENAPSPLTKGHESHKKTQKTSHPRHRTPDLNPPTPLCGFGEDIPAFMQVSFISSLTPEKGSNPIDMRYGTVVKPPLEKDHSERLDS